MRTNDARRTNSHSSARSGGGRSRSSTGRSHSRPAPSKARSIWDELPVQVVPTENLPSFAELGLPSEIVDGLKRRGIATPFPIQAATIPDALTGRDVLGRAATGSGKTLAFGLAMIARLDGGQRKARSPRGLVLVPTRELAMQVADALGAAARDRGMRTMIVAGGMPINKQINQLADGVDIVVATPGRLVDLIERRSCRLDSVEVTVLDEADHMADLGFLPVVRDLLNQTPSNGQRLLFSATLDGDVATLVDNYLVDPAVHALSTAGASVSTMTHHMFRVEQDKKFDLVASIAAREGRSILFVRTKHGADRLARNLARAGVAAGALHGDRSQSQRTRALNDFKDGSVPVLVATDVAARGIHVDEVSLVLHVDAPPDPKDYLHRSGRTARAGEDGVVVLLTSYAEERKDRKMLTEAGVDVTMRDALPGDQAVAQLTGARKPSGVPVAEQQRTAPNPYRAAAKAKAADRPSAPRTGGSRPSAGGSASRHPQSGERRARRPRTH